MEGIIIRRITLADIHQLQQVAKETFFEAFAGYNTEANMQQYLEEKFSLAKLTTEVNDNHAELYFAEVDGKAIGYLKLNFGASQTELKDDRAVEIERIYVAKEFHGKKAGQLLYEKALQVAEVKGATYLWLGVWEQNARAIAFYQKNGFVEFDKHLFKLGTDVQTDIMMKKTLPAIPRDKTTHFS